MKKKHGDIKKEKLCFDTIDWWDHCLTEIVWEFSNTTICGCTSFG